MQAQFDSYASPPAVGGVDHFLQVAQAVVAVGYRPPSPNFEESENGASLCIIVFHLFHQLNYFINLFSRVLILQAFTVIIGVQEVFQEVIFL